jgi:Glycosyl transferase family 11.
MVITRLCGGLGNQLFQYAAGLALSNRLKVPITIDNYYYQHQPAVNTPRQFLLDRLSLKYCFASRREQYLAGKIFSANRFQRKFGRALKSILLSPYSFYREPMFYVYDVNLLKSSCNTVIDGYWQSFRYLQPIEALLRKDVVVLPQYRHEQQDVLDICTPCQGIFVHVRRGDYVSNPSAAAHHVLTSTDYYRASIEKCSNEITNPYFVLFSDDIIWVKENIVPLLSDKKYKIFKSQDPYGLDDFFHMSKCSHAIITNSSFSWWAAWLISNKNKLVIAPKKWLKNSSQQFIDLIPPNWITI